MATNFNNPYIPPFDYVVFGGSGDLATRKLLPSLFRRDRDGQIPPVSRIIGASRSQFSRPDYQAFVEKNLHEFLDGEDVDGQTWNRFRERLYFVPMDAAAEAGWPDLVALLQDSPREVRVFYLATAPHLFGPIARRIAASGALSPDARVVLEKPIGHDLASAQRINDEVGTVFPEHRIFRIDHYLGKETVQNLLVLRFANSLFEPLWQSQHIDHVQITVAESIGIESRGGYYDRTGALRDMVQNHLLQLLCLVAMEPPASLDREAVRDEKIKVLRALAPIVAADVGHKTVRGQYRAGAIEGAPVRGYFEEADVAGASTTETFTAIKAEISNWRWAGVPFYLRTGKRMPQKVSEIVIQFRPVPHWVFPGNGAEATPDRLIIRVQPDEYIRLNLWTKEPGPGGLRLRMAGLNLSFAETFKSKFPDAYERLLMDVVRGNATLFMRRDEVEAAWTWIDQILGAWAETGDRPRPYTAGTWGPSSAIALIERDNRTWFEEQSDGS
ncbi:MAG TPA: glucose-6-phosphate dehydrogenase [Acetobacteraceae bacterium]|jgi:glucose-6-phosphate 1-dehydrogenase|nr:glucose-6-phosphate dehydrogenase [Acetobacteraceae bacterium]